MRAPLFVTPMAALLLAGCGQSDDAAATGGVTASEAQQLNQAADALDQGADADNSATPAPEDQ